MDLTRLRALLRRHRRIALDTSVFIYQLEGNPRYSPLTAPLFAWLEGGSRSGVTSTITLAEILVHPYRKFGDRGTDELFATLTTFPNLSWVAPDIPISDQAARIRATHRLRLPDAIHAATALLAGATALVTNDPVFRRVPDLDILVLDDLFRDVPKT